MAPLREAAERSPQAQALLPGAASAGDCEPWQGKGEMGTQGRCGPWPDRGEPPEGPCGAQAEDAPGNAAAAGGGGNCATLALPAHVTNGLRWATPDDRCA